MPRSFTLSPPPGSATDASNIGVVLSTACFYIGRAKHVLPESGLNEPCLNVSYFLGLMCVCVTCVSAEPCTRKCFDYVSANCTQGGQKGWLQYFLESLSFT